jgi:hypothetical protein
VCGLNIDVQLIEGIFCGEGRLVRERKGVEEMTKTNNGKLKRETMDRRPVSLGF